MSYIKGDNPTEQRHFDFLERLRQSGATNMWGATPYLADAFDEFDGREGYKRASEVLIKWTSLHNDPERRSHTPFASQEPK